MTLPFKYCGSVSLLSTILSKY